MKSADQSSLQRPKATDVELLNLQCQNVSANKPSQIKNPKSINLDLPSIVKEINSPKKIEVSDLKRVPPSSVKLVSDSHFPKTYRAWIASASPFSKEDVSKLNSFDHVLNQRTPERVAHRRADKIRKRRANVLTAKLEEGKIILDIRADAGTYIKELIHGDKGRTTPSFSSVLGKECTCEKLDVIEIDDDFLKLVLA